MKVVLQFKYKAFISYSHAADGKLAPALQTALHRFAKPWYRLRAMHVFRDETSLAMTPELWPSIEKALGESEYFLLLASPEAACSEWVQKEADWWIEHRTASTLFILLTDGEVIWDGTVGDFDWTRSTALPANLRSRFKSEPLYVDLRWARSEATVSLQSSQFRAAILDVASPLLGRSKDELDGEDVRQHRRTKAVVGIAIAAIVALAGAAAWQAFAATQQKKEAESQRSIAQLRQQEAEAARDRAELQRKKTLDLITWVTNQTAGFDIDKWGFSEDAQELLSGLGARLSDAGFKGKVIIEGRVAPYCVVYDNKKEHQVHLAPDDLPLAKCDFYPTVAAYNLVIGEKRARELRRLLQSLELPGIEFQVMAYGRVEPFADDRDEIRTARDWNRRAKRFNRLHVVLSETKQIMREAPGQ